MSSSDSQNNYLVLARKYRPLTFADMVGQEALVQTLKNAIAAGRIHHAYVLTGIRGTGKTTTARILAKALNCENGPSIEWAADDPQCQAITDSKHVDVLEFDAASHTGVDDIRELFEGVNYAPVQGRYKVYIIDEVHMLSKQAFNALLKTLEEPPAHVKFIFATTEVHKIPVTVLSRCQRIDTKRVPSTVLADYFARLLGLEGVEAEPAALQMIARAADGSVRDGLSLLDQAIALSAGPVKADTVQDMLGLSDRAQMFDLLEAVFQGEAAQTLAVFQKMYGGGLDPLLAAQDTLQVLHLLTKIKVVPGLAESGELTEIERTRGVPLAQNLSLEGLSRAYQMMLTAAEEAKKASRPHEAVEMALIRMTHVAPLPAISQLLAAQGGAVTQVAETEGLKKPKAPADAPAAQQAAVVLPQPQPEVQPAQPQPDKAKEQKRQDAAQNEAVSNPFTNWRALVKAVRDVDSVLASILEEQVMVAAFAHGEVDVFIAKGLYDAREVHSRFADVLFKLTGERWQLNVVAQPEGGQTLAQQKAAEKQAALAKAKNHPEIRRIQQALPDAEVVDIQLVD